jgi:hypothetical protein
MALPFLVLVLEPIDSALRSNPNQDIFGKACFASLSKNILEFV